MRAESPGSGEMPGDISRDRRTPGAGRRHYCGIKTAIEEEGSAVVGTEASVRMDHGHTHHPDGWVDRIEREKPHRVGPPEKPRGPRRRYKRAFL